MKLPKIRASVVNEILYSSIDDITQAADVEVASYVDVDLLRGTCWLLSEENADSVASIQLGFTFAFMCFKRALEVEELEVVSVN